jgi:flagellar hook-associated protein 3 FlgL
MLSGIAASNTNFLNNLNADEARISKDNQEISSGVRVNVASDDPTAVIPLVDDQNQIAGINQTITNLDQQQTVLQTADGALQTASSLLNQLISLGTEGATSTSSAASRASLGEQVQEIQQQLVALANTSVNGQYVFGGDSPYNQPYTYKWSASEGVVSGGSPTNTQTTEGLDGASIVAGQTAGQIFDAKLPGGSPDPGNVFQAVYQLGTALLANDQTGVQTALSSLQTAANHLSEANVQYGESEDWVQEELTEANNRSTSLTGEVSDLRDADVASLATDLSQGQVSLQAALSAEASLPNRSLFSYLG